ncbi:hypothetical protein EVAR_50973_1 [Eumeta japonica]|uniref:Uncharacterized protein n=1 Tax=Eumeta variegata TaxID=151549 RepID=A0A4C1XE57_EUMVA|nr:hypothetical protein EVAR_50973_1 [Eumeta japonica]
MCAFPAPSAASRTRRSLRSTGRHGNAPVTSHGALQSSRSGGSWNGKALPTIGVAQQSLARFRTAFGEEAPCKTTIYDWLWNSSAVVSISVTNFVMVARPPPRTTKILMLCAVSSKQAGM